MVQKLKTFVTSLGFFDLAVAAPSMKAAMEAWGIKHNVFGQGHASQTNDSEIIEATTAKPGIVLRRPVGTAEPFRVEAELPKGFSLPSIRQAPSLGKPRKAPSLAKQKRPANPQTENKVGPTAIISFENARAERERARIEEDAVARRDAVKRSSAIEKAQQTLEDARKDHQTRCEKLKRDQAALNRRLQEEDVRWQKERRKLEAALDKARRS